MLKYYAFHLILLVQRQSLLIVLLLQQTICTTVTETTTLCPHSHLLCLFPLPVCCLGLDLVFK